MEMGEEQRHEKPGQCERSVGKKRELGGIPVSSQAGLVVPTALSFSVTQEPECTDTSEHTSTWEWSIA